ncbi:MAG: DsrE/DsrF/DrsH-like family protein [Oscillospiraceae bacterium]|nr:DsrE/DsrF/DrsH-like family protein [Oscillospiraceae bacterium]MBP5743332.1 DsrE/DsrF/DrsH-like family protein [Oscillospiraceae bacterium]
MDEIKHISAEEFAKLDRSTLTLLDLREPDQVLLGALEGAVNIPFSHIGKELEKLPKDKPVYVFCQEGSLSTEITEQLQDWGYDAINLDGGWRAWKKWLEEAEPITLDAKGLKCPGPIVKTADTLRGMANGQRLRIEATEDAFASDIAVWCERTGNRLLKLEVKPELIEALVEKADSPIQNPAVVQNDKTFVVFSGDLDKTIAAFIMANGAAAMGRRVTMFFTFWGLNILRRPEKVSVAKSFIERMFGSMMPRGTKKLGLSRMNMGGLGAKMIRGIMKEKGVSSLEDLIESARSHGVRLVACQMSMDIMGIKKEELIDGVELGGVSTFLGSGEQSDMSLFI